MKALDNIMNAVDFMEENLNKKISAQQISFRSTYSVYHFCRVFAECTGDTPGNYLRKRRLTLAAKAILFEGKEIIDTAFEYQFDTQEGFTRAFKTYFGVTPGKCRQTNKDISRYFTEKLSISQLLMKNGVSIMNPKFVDCGELKFVGMPIFTKDQKDIFEVWKSFMHHEAKIKNRTLHGICAGLEYYTDEFFNTGKFFYMPAIQVESFDDIPIELSGKIIPSAKYAVFTHCGHIKDIPKTISAAYKTWIPELELKVSRSYDFEFYDHRFKPDSHESEVDFYIPIS